LDAAGAGPSDFAGSATARAAKHAPSSTLSWTQPGRLGGVHDDPDDVTGSPTISMRVAPVHRGNVPSELRKLGLRSSGESRMSAGSASTGSPLQPEFVAPSWHFKVGMHCGPVTAGVVGSQRTFFRLVGDTVNVASRMGSTGQTGRIHLSRNAYRSLGRPPILNSSAGRRQAALAGWDRAAESVKEEGELSDSEEEQGQEQGGSGRGGRGRNRFDPIRRSTSQRRSRSRSMPSHAETDDSDDPFSRERPSSFIFLTGDQLPGDDEGEDDSLFDN